MVSLKRLIALRNCSKERSICKRENFGFPTSPLCWLNQKDRNKISKACEKYDAAIALSCNAGSEGIKTALPEPFKVVPGMATVGTIAAYLSIQNGKVILDKTKTKVVRFKEMKQTI